MISAGEHILGLRANGEVLKVVIVAAACARMPGVLRVRNGPERAVADAAAEERMFSGTEKSDGPRSCCPPGAGIDFVRIVRETFECGQEMVGFCLQTAAADNGSRVVAHVLRQVQSAHKIRTENLRMGRGYK